MVEIRIGLPLPMDVASTVLQIIGKTYPGTVIAKDSENKRRYKREIVLEIPDDERHNTPKAKKKYLKWRRGLQKWDSDITQLGPDGVSVAPFEWLAKQWAVMAQRSFELEPAAVNYLEGQVFTKDVPGRFVFYIAKSDRQTPHELRTIAETQLADTREQLQFLTEALEAVGGCNNIRAARTVVKKALGQDDDN